MSKCIFKYMLQDAWGNDISEIKIYDQETRNLFCAFVEDKTISSKSFTIEKECIEEIKKLFSKELFCIDEIEFPLVLDGVINKFKFVTEGKEKNLICFNLWAFEKDGFKNASNAKILCDVFNKIKGICVKQCDCEKYFDLGY